ncbi:EF-hand domain-containing protein [Glycomyces tritici]|uniref:EF-hand domain-containing protein n=1 Tax=Glycomyces tritici TaxID=2665176 RepID=A0ABT7YXD4_9ACTN|nr:EF-hand domain-containing protein [Glycomyces tritici]MDN3243019.1 EF-hand domain-containing protein [Glycomyces tritici]
MTAKIEYGFDHLDTTGDGRLGEHDHIQMGKRAATGLGHAPGSPEEGRIVAAYTAIWNDLHRPHLPAGQEDIDKATFVASSKTLAQDPDAADAVLGALARTYLSIADVDGSGDVSAEEFAVFLRSHFPGLNPNDIDKAFTYLDRDGSGRLSAEEFVAAVVEYWSSADINAPGNWWMGQPIYER